MQGISEVLALCLRMQFIFTYSEYSSTLKHEPAFYSPSQIPGKHINWTGDDFNDEPNAFLKCYKMYSSKPLHNTIQNVKETLEMNA